MIEVIAQKIGIGVMVVGMTMANWLGVVPSDYFIPPVKEIETKVVHEYLPAPAPVLGSTYSTPEVRALFTTSLASKITSSATSMTLVSATDKDGTTLASSTYGFIIDEGTSVEEFVLADCTGTTCTNMTRGISVNTATTSVAALQFEHRRGASVKITTAPSVVFLMNVVKGKQNIENKLRYNSAQTFNNSTDIISRDYADSLAFGAVPAASETASGFVELATGVEVASSTSSGSAARLSIPASLATSTYNSATAPLKVVVTGNDGKIDNNFIDSSSGLIASTTEFITGIKLLNIGKNFQVFTATSSLNIFTVPSGVTHVYVRLVGGGGGGGGGSGSDTTQGAGGGGGGGYAENICDVTGLSTVSVKVGEEGARGTAVQSTPNGGQGGTSYFGACVSATGGYSGTSRTDINIGGLGGIASTTIGKALFGSAGQIGGTGIAYTGGLGQLGGFGGGSLFGSGSLPSNSGDANGTDCATSTNGYGGGGSGAEVNTTNRTGGLGCPGLVIINW